MKKVPSSLQLPVMILVFLKFLVLRDTSGNSSKKEPSTMGTKGNSTTPKLPVSLKTRLKGSVLRRHSMTDSISSSDEGQLTAAAKARLRDLASFLSMIAQGQVGPPDCIIAWEKRLRLKGDKRWKLTETAPADSPKRVTFFGFPPKASMLS